MMHSGERDKNNNQQPTDRKKSSEFLDMFIGK